MILLMLFTMLLMGIGFILTLIGLLERKPIPLLIGVVILTILIFIAPYFPWS